MATDYAKRTRKFCIELYPDNENHVEAIDRILTEKIGYNKARWVGILHDRDTYEEETENHKEGETKKAHYHFCIELKDGKTRKTLAKHLGIEERFIEPCEKWKASLMYLIHFNVDKYQYEVGDLIGDTEFIQYIAETSQRDNKYLQFNNINNYIKNCNGEIAFTDLCEVCYKNGWLSALTKNQNLFINAVNQHNKHIAK